MEEINIKNLKIKFEISSILEFINSKKSFEMDFYGNIYPINETSKTMPLVFRRNLAELSNEIQSKITIENIFEKEYKAKIIDTHCEITPVGAWQSIIVLNQDRMTYFDHQTDGIELFEEKELENIGWQAVSLNIKYRDLCNYLEKECEGIFIYYDNDMHFNGFVILKDIEEAKEKMYEFVLIQIEENIKNEELFLDELDNDEKEALAFFKYKG